MTRHMALCDVHVPRNIPLDPVLKFAQMYRPTELIINGDFLNLEFASHWNEAIFKQLGLAAVRENLEKELEAGRDMLKMIRQAVPSSTRIHYVPGNHESWLYWCGLYYGWPDPRLPHREINFKSDLASVIDLGLKHILERELQTEKFKVTVLKYNDPLQLGKITYVHGHTLSLSNSIKMFPDRNLVFGHWHTHNVVTLHNSGDHRRAIQHVAVPALTPLCPGYLKSKSSRWLNGFWAADILDNGLFDGRTVKVLEGKIIGPRL